MKKRMLPNTACSVHPISGKVRRSQGGGSLRTPCGQSGSLCGLKLVPSKWRCLVPPNSTPHKHAGHNANRWVARPMFRCSHV